MERLTQTSDRGGVAFTFNLDITCNPSEAKKILRLAEKLKKYEDAEEQGLLLKLPCKIGDTVYSIRELCDLKGTKVVSEFTVCRFELKKLQQFVVNFDGHRLNIANFGKTIFLSKKEAEKALADITEDSNLVSYSK